MQDTAPELTTAETQTYVRPNPTYQLTWATELVLTEERHRPARMNARTLEVNRIFGRNVHSFTLEDVRGDCIRLTAWVSRNGLRAEPLSLAAVRGRYLPFGDGFLYVTEVKNHSEPPTATIEILSKRR